MVGLKKGMATFKYLFGRPTQKCLQLPPWHPGKVLTFQLFLPFLNPKVFQIMVSGPSRDAIDVPNPWCNMATIPAAVLF
jgi:hypothetical protein